jgi:MFS family permease
LLLRSIPVPAWDNRAPVHSFDRYRLLLRQPELRRLIAVSVVGRLPIGVTGLAILLAVQHASGSFAAGGAASGAYVFGLALVAPLLGRTIDRIGPRPPLYACAALFPAALLGLAATVLRGWPAGWVYVFSGLAGATFPPITVCMRTFLRRQLVDEALLTAAFSVETVLIETIFIGGPMLVALFVAYASPVTAVVFAAVCGALGTALFAGSRPLREWRIDRLKKRAGASLLGPLHHPPFLGLLAVVLAYSTAFGFLEVGVTAYATERERPALAGLLLAITSIGSALGGIAYGSRGWHYPLGTQLAGTLVLMALGLAALALPMQPLVYGVVCAVAGVVMAPALIIQSMLVAKTAPPEHSTEAFTWSTSALLSGVGIGLSIGGALLEVASPHASLAAGALAALLAAAFTRLAAKLG